MRKVEENKEILNSTCEICGAKFTCNAKDIESCFCNKIVVPEEISEQIKNKYSRCLCEVCLQNFTK